MRVKALRSRSDERAPTPPPATCTALTSHDLSRSTRTGGDA